MKSILLLSLSTILLPAALLAGTPRLSHVSPAAGQRGTEVEVSFSGTNLGDANGLQFDEPGLTCAEIKSENNRVKAKIKIAPEARLGEHNFRIITQSGISDVRLFYVTPFPLVAELAEDKVDSKKPQPISLGVTVTGASPNEDEDRYEVDMKKGQRLSVESIGARIQTQNFFDPAIAVLKADGTPIMQGDDGAFSRQDPVLSLIVPEDGKYLITIRDSTNSGPGQSSYLLNVGTFPRPIAVHPAGGMAGEEVKFTFIGDATGPIQRTIKLPDNPVDFHPLFVEDGQPAPQPITVRASPFPNALEAEPNDAIDKATPTGTAIPLACNGIIEKPGDVDYFKVSAKKGADYDIAVYARRLRSALDPVVEVYNAKGSRLGTNDDSGDADSYLRWKAPDDGDYFVAVRDQLARGGPAFTYRVEITNLAPRVALYLPEMTQNQNQDRRAVPVPKGNRYATLVRARRQDVGGDMTLQPVGLPDGITVSGGFMDKAVDTVPVVFEAKADAPTADKAFTLAAKFAEPDKANVPSKIEHLVYVAENGNQRPYYTVTEDRLAAAVTDAVPAKIELAQPKVPILQNGAMTLKVRVERTGDFKGPLTIGLLYAPPGIGTPGTVPIKEGENEGSLTISANSNAPAGKWKTCIVASVDTGKGPIWISTQLIELEIAPAPVAGSITRTFIDQGDEGSMTLKLEHKQPFEGKAKVQLVSLPNGVTCEEREITKDDKEVRFKLKAEPNAQAGQHKQVIARFILEKDGEPMMSSIAGGGILRVDKATVAAAK
ncbi:MAG: PPC domain-containing protein [Chthoniobacteraceae bacterium]